MKSKINLCQSNLLTQAVLTPDAFAKAIEIKQSETEFALFLKKIYSDQDSNYQYESKAGTKQFFYTQIQHLMKTIHQWGLENKLDQTTLAHVIPFVDRLLTAGEKHPPHNAKVDAAMHNGVTPWYLRYS